MFPTSVLRIASLLPVIGFAEASNVFADFESGQVGVQVSNVFEPINGWSFADSLSILFFDAVFYFVLGVCVFCLCCPPLQYYVAPCW